MNNLRSELFWNRMLLWTVIALIQASAGKYQSAWISMIPACYNAWKSLRAWKEVD